MENDKIFEKDYEKLEFLGDALMEYLIMANAYKIFDEKDIRVRPFEMHKIKVILLSNSFMARITVLTGIYKYLMNIDEE